MHKTKWVISNESTKGTTIAERVLFARGIISKQDQEAFVSPSYTNGLADPLLLKNAKKACIRIKQAVDKAQKIVIYGDYDIDGLTATTLMTDFATMLGANVSCYIPDRYEEGYGLNLDSLDKLAKDGAELVITVDCGVTATKELAYAKKIGLDVIVTDHHEPPETLPSGQFCMVNPRIKGCKYPFKDLAGVGVAFTLVRAYMKLYGAPDKGQEKWLLDLVALGTVCDVVPLVAENRILAHWGLVVMRKTPRFGLQELMKVSGVIGQKVSSSDLGFRLGPRLNAAGRLEHAKAALALLQSKNREEAKEFSMGLNELNIQRQLQTTEIFNAADSLAKKHREDMVLVLADKAWLHGVVGIVASKISEKYHKPTILLQTEGTLTKGSARSYGDFSIIEAIRACSDQLIKFGGHDFAAGMSLETERIAEFRYRINEYAKTHIDVSSLVESIHIDASLQGREFTLATIEQLSSLEPFGRDNKEPLFVSQLTLRSIRIIGSTNNHQKFVFESDNSTVDGIAFSSIHKWPNLETDVDYDVVFRLQNNEYQGVSRVQIEVIDIKQLNK